MLVSVFLVLLFDLSVYWMDSLLRHILLSVRVVLLRHRGFVMRMVMQTAQQMATEQVEAEIDAAGTGEEKGDGETIPASEEAS